MNKKKHILFIMQLPPPVHGVSVMNRIIRDSALVNGAFACDYINLTTATSIDDLGKNRLIKYASFLSIFFKAFYKMLTVRYDHIYITVFPYGLAFFKDSAIVLLARLLGQKPLLHMHVYGIKKAAARSKLKIWYYKLTFRHAEVICLSELLKEDITPVFNGIIHILPNGIPQVNFENRYKAKREPLIVLYLSNLIKSKGILLLVEAVAILRQKHMAPHVRIVGAEGDITYNELKALIQSKDLAAHITLVGPKYNSEKHHEFEQAGLFVFPTSSDTFGLVLLEALQFGVPCISTNVGAIPDVLGNERGLIVKDMNANALAAAIGSLLHNPAKRQQMSDAGFAYFESHFTTAVFEKRLVSILNGEA